MRYNAGLISPDNGFKRRTHYQFPTIHSMNDIDLLKKIPKEHYTSHEGKTIKVGDLLNKLYEKDTNNGIARNRKNHSGNKTRK